MYGPDIMYKKTTCQHCQYTLSYPEDLDLRKVRKDICFDRTMEAMDALRESDDAIMQEIKSHLPPQYELIRDQYGNLITRIKRGA